MREANRGGPGLVGRAVRALHRLVHPDHADERARLDAYARKVDKHAAAQREHLAALRAEMDRLAGGLSHHATRNDLRAIDQTLERIREASDRHYRLTAQAVRSADWQEELRVVERRLKNRLAGLARSRGPIVVGPWTGEVGFELLYWIPFVTRAVERARIDGERLVIVSRGGAQPWYAHLGGRYLDVLSFVPPDAFRAATEAQKKQWRVGPFDRSIVRRVMAAVGERRVQLVHPGLMYPLFRPVWKGRETSRRIEEHATHRLINVGALPDMQRRLPSRYIAVRFYFSTCFPDTPGNRALVGSIVRRLAQNHDVVLLNTGIEVDDHRDFLPDAHDRIHSVDDLMRPERNLDVQTAVVAKADAFVGTYGGYSYLAPLCGVPSIAFYSDLTFQHAHLEVAQRVFRRIGAGALTPLDVRSVDLLSQALPSR